MIATATNQQKDVATPNPWSAVGSMTLCVAMLIASEFLPVSLLTPIAADLRATEGMAGQAISISGLFAVVTSLFIATIAGRFDRRHVLIVLTTLMLASLVLIAEAQNFVMFMASNGLSRCRRCTTQSITWPPVDTSDNCSKIVSSTVDPSSILGGGTT